MTSPPSTTSRVRGSILGVAVVDALGAPAEFMERGQFPKVERMLYNDNFRLPVGTWTDDTSMTLCLAQSLVDNKGGFNVQDQIRKYVRWYRDGYMSATGFCFDIGGTTRLALGTWDQYFKLNPNIDPLDPEGHIQGQELVNKPLNRKNACGNGSLMRVAPIGLVYRNDLDQAGHYATLSSEVTHPYTTNGEACHLYTRLVALAARGGATKDRLAADISRFEFSDETLKARFTKHRPHPVWSEVREDEISSSGYVVNSLEAALWAFFTTDGFRDGAIKVVNLGDDADTVGAIYGGLAGAFYGLDAIPNDWLRDLQKREVVEEVASALANVAGD
ncbi:MAG: hypothetical protein M1832_001656 [Thelocarpon impressellum]|nr:MAG: hypothetical protein M1832_001656 [Thelocarpon impressellum]